MIVQEGVRFRGRPGENRGEAFGGEPEVWQGSHRCRWLWEDEEGGKQTNSPFKNLLDHYKVLQNKAEEDEKKMMQLEADLKAARTAAEDADASYEEISKKLLQCEADLERAEERAETGASIIFIFSKRLVLRRFFSIFF